MLLQTLAGDAVLIRTGHEELWGAPNYYLDIYPGLGVNARGTGSRAGGGNLAVGEEYRPDRLGQLGHRRAAQPQGPAGLLAPVHHHFLAKSGIPMQESRGRPARRVSPLAVY